VTDKLFLSVQENKEGLGSLKTVIAKAVTQAKLVFFSHQNSVYCALVFQVSSFTQL